MVEFTHGEYPLQMKHRHFYINQWMQNVRTLSNKRM